MLSRVAEAPMVAFDTETNGLDLYGQDGPPCDLVGLSVYHPAYTTHLTEQGGVSHDAIAVDACAYYVPVNHGLGTFEPNRKTKAGQRACDAFAGAYDYKRIARNNVPEGMVPKLRGLLTGKIAVAHNAQFDLTVLAQAGFDLPKQTFDTDV
jgi:DNA polymerase III epsilon subunit-like protein